MLEIKFLENGFTNGFNICYEGPQNRRSSSENIPITVGDEVELWNKLMKEVKMKTVAGPFDEIPFEIYIQSVINLVPKAGQDATRLIFHLSYDFKRDGLKSVNFYTPKEKCMVKYKDLDFAVKMYLDLCDEIIDHAEDLEECDSLPNADNKPSREELKGKWHKQFEHHSKRKRGYTTIFAGKSDLKSAFRILGLAAACWKWLIMKA